MDASAPSASDGNATDVDLRFSPKVRYWEVAHQTTPNSEYRARQFVSRATKEGASAMECAASGGALAVLGSSWPSAPRPAKAASQPLQSKGKEPPSHS
jgi:hypothetical protein